MNSATDPLFLFRVEDVFEIQQRGCVLLPGVPAPSDQIPVIRKEAAILLRRPDGSERATFIRALESIRRDKFHPEVPILLPRDLTKEDVPIGTEVWLARTGSGDLQCLWSDGDLLDVGRAIYESIPVLRRPVWAAAILDLCRSRHASIPAVDSLYAIADDTGRWHEAHDGFTAVRLLTLACERSDSCSPT